MSTLPPLPEWVRMEHQVAKILTQQELHGWYFNESEARNLESALRREVEETSRLLRRQHPYVAGAVFTPKRNNRTQGYIEGAPFTRLKELNPTSRDHIAWILQTHYGWTPSLMTLKSNKPIIDEPVLKDVGKDIALDFLKILELTKALGMISEGVNAWQKLVTKSRIHHHCSVATSTFRCAHRSPNLAQVPSDERFRKLFQATPGKVMVGADLSGIELRMLAHYLARFDQGRYSEILLTGDIHQTNADAIGVTRRQVKTITYAFLYGAGNTKIGYTYDKQLSEVEAKKKGKEIRKAYVAAIPGLKELLAAVHERSAKGYVHGLDHRRILVDSRHKSLNYLIQGSSAIVAKRWLLMVQEYLQELAVKDVHQLAFIHDELQYECAPSFVNEFKTILESKAKVAGRYYKMRCPVAAESKSGHTWADVH
jgi:DNA polymerase I-like protein with 3'-5' exonuclease and polymerase domains